MMFRSACHFIGPNPGWFSFLIDTQGNAITNNIAPDDQSGMKDSF